MRRGGSVRGRQGRRGGSRRVVLLVELRSSLSDARSAMTGVGRRRRSQELSSFEEGWVSFVFRLGPSLSSSFASQQEERYMLDHGRKALSYSREEGGKGKTTKSWNGRGGPAKRGRARRATRHSKCFDRFCFGRW